MRTISEQREALVKEQRANQQSWKVREAQLRSVEADRTSLVGDLVGLGAPVPKPARFELEPASDVLNPQAVLLAPFAKGLSA